MTRSKLLRTPFVRLVNGGKAVQAETNISSAVWEVLKMPLDRHAHLTIAFTVSNADNHEIKRSSCRSKYQ
jgi:hypothetical protein